MHLESWQMFEIDRPGDAAQARELERRVRASLEDVRRAVRDFPAMLERSRAVANELERAIIADAEVAFQRGTRAARVDA